MNDEQIRIRVSEADKRLMQDAAIALGLSLSAFIRLSALKAARRTLLKGVAR
jgi:uncharacterized protein (DUF1778 family)